MNKYNTHAIFKNVRPEESSFIRGITFIPDEDVIEVLLETHSGKCVNPYYYTCGEELFKSFVTADSYGKYYSDWIKTGNEVTTDEVQVSEHISDTLKSHNKHVREICSELDKTRFSEAEREDFIQELVDFLYKRSSVDPSIFRRENNGGLYHYSNTSAELLQLLEGEIEGCSVTVSDDIMFEITKLSELFDGLTTPIII